MCTCRFNHSLQFRGFIITKIHMIMLHVHAVDPCNHWNSSNVTYGGQMFILTGKKTHQLPFSNQHHHNCSITTYLWFYAWSTDLDDVESLNLNHHVSKPDTPDVLLQRIIWKRWFQKNMSSPRWLGVVLSDHRPDRNLLDSGATVLIPAQFLNTVIYLIRHVVQTQSPP